MNLPAFGVLWLAASTTLVCLPFVYMPEVEVLAWGCAPALGMLT